MTNELDLTNLRNLVEGGNVLDKTTVLTLIARVEYLDRQLDAADRQIEARSGTTAAERIWIARAEQAEQAVARVRGQRDKWEREGSAYWISAEAAVIALDYALRTLDGEQR